MNNTVFLNTNREMPLLGLGVYKATGENEAENAVISAVEAGYRLIDTASVYKNEENVGRGIAKCGIPRSDPEYNDSNEKGQLYTGDKVFLQQGTDTQYWYVYAPKYQDYGYVNKDYLVKDSNASNTSTSSYNFPVIYKTVKVDKGYLALRSEKSFNSGNEKGELYTGDVVEVRDSSDPTYWLVYSSKYNDTGYVNMNYLH